MKAHCENHDDFAGYLDELEKAGVDEVWSNYRLGYYDGWGYALIRKGSQYDLLHCGHCSCNDALESFQGSDHRYHSLKLLQSVLSNELREETESLFKQAVEAKR